MNTREAMNQRTAIERRTSTSDSGGGFTDSWASVATGVPCRVWAMRIRSPGVIGELGSAETIAGMRPGIIELTGVLMPKSTDVNQGDRLVSVTDRLGKVVREGPMMVDSIGIQPDHLRVTARRIN